MVIALLATTTFLWIIQTKLSENNAINLLALNISDVREDIIDASDEHLLQLTRQVAESCARTQNSGMLEKYLEAAKKVCAGRGVTVCDCYAKWKEISKTQDVTMLLANRINHPIPEMHELFAQSLYDMIIGESNETGKTESDMFEQ